MIKVKIVYIVLSIHVKPKPTHPSCPLAVVYFYLGILWFPRYVFIRFPWVGLDEDKTLTVLYITTSLEFIVQLFVVFDSIVCYPTINYGETPVIRIKIVVVQGIVFACAIELLIRHGVHGNELLEILVVAGLHYVGQYKVALHCVNKYGYVSTIPKVCSRRQGHQAF